MKIKFISAVLILLIFSCNMTQQDDKITIDVDETSSTDLESSVVYDSTEALWSYDFNQQTEEMELKQIRTIDSGTLKGETIETIINKTWPRIQVKYTRVSNDTVFITIPESAVLTQQMGSAGAESFMITTTYSFTELVGIDYVSFDFEVGDHANPGVYHRNSWKKTNQ